MAAQSLSISVSRRSILANGIAASTLALPPPPFAAPGLPFCDPDADAALCRRLAIARRCWAGFVRSREEADRLCRETFHHPEFTRPPGFTEAGRAGFAALAKRTGYHAAAARCTRLHDRYIAVAHAAFDIPARGLRGVAAKLRFGVSVARDGMVGSFADNEFELLDRAMDDFMEIANAFCRAQWRGRRPGDTSDDCIWR